MQVQDLLCITPTGEYWFALVDLKLYSIIKSKSSLNSRTAKLLLVLHVFKWSQNNFINKMFIHISFIFTASTNKLCNLTWQKSNQCKFTVCTMRFRAVKECVNIVFNIFGKVSFSNISEKNKTFIPKQRHLFLIQHNVKQNENIFCFVFLKTIHFLI